jgi:16S rRNA (adenine1518-N6/adenine1519-N6)-dimethyltransferase
MGFQNRVKPKRSLGQNFFINSELKKKIVNTVLQEQPEHITEIGPGKGAFTKAFYDLTDSLTLVEKDSLMADILENKFPDADIHNVDFLEFKLGNTQTVYFGSLPFNVANDIIKKIISSYTFTNPAFFVIQKEVAEKYRNIERNPLGLIREIYADFEKMFDIKPGNFKPRPNVTSSFVKFVPHEKYTDIDKGALELLIERSFRMPRKTVRNNLKPYNYDIPITLEGKRPHEIDLKGYVSILGST